MFIIYRVVNNLKLLIHYSDLIDIYCAEGKKVVSSFFEVVPIFIRSSFTIISLDVENIYGDEKNVFKGTPSIHSVVIVINIIVVNYRITILVVFIMVVDLYHSVYCYFLNYGFVTVRSRESIRLDERAYYLTI